MADRYSFSKHVKTELLDCTVERVQFDKNGSAACWFEPEAEEVLKQANNCTLSFLEVFGKLEGSCLRPVLIVASERFVAFAKVEHHGTPTLFGPGTVLKFKVVVAKAH